jgi:hypothetical protein
MLYNRTAFFADKVLTSSKLFDISKEYARKRFLTSTYANDLIDIKNILEKYVKRSNGTKFEFPSLPELREYLYNYDNSYYKYINGMTNDEIITDFTHDSGENNSYNDISFI